MLLFFIFECFSLFTFNYLKLSFLIHLELCIGAIYMYLCLDKEELLINTHAEGLFPEKPDPPIHVLCVTHFLMNMLMLNLIFRTEKHIAEPFIFIV
jgi:hypothetical protein